MLRQLKIMICLYLAVCVWAWPAYAGYVNRPLAPQVLEYAGVFDLRQIEPNLDGTGLKFAVLSRSITYLDGEPQNDYRPEASHNCFNPEALNFYDDGQLPAENSPHSTAVCSLLIGSDTNAQHPQLGEFIYQAAAPKARADVYEFWHFLKNNVFPNRRPDADVVVACIGSPFENWWTRGIDALAENYGLVIVAGIGNGSDSFDPPLYPAAGSNVIAVGVIDSVNSDDLATSLANFALAYPVHSSLGPAGDGRSKPDIVAPGNCLAAGIDEPNLYKPTGDWSSFSTPVVAGAVGLLIQKARTEPALKDILESSCKNCLFKAILLNSARKLPYWHKGFLTKDDDHTAPLDRIQGAGALDAVAAYKLLSAGKHLPGSCPQTGWDLNRIPKTMTENVYQIDVPQPADKILAVTLAWNNHYENSYPFEPLAEQNSNLRLEVRAVDYNNYLLDYSDSTCDNLEHIFVSLDPNRSSYDIVVSHSGLDEHQVSDSAETYAIAWAVIEKPDTDNILLYDLNADGIVDESDLAAVLDNYLNILKDPTIYFLGDTDNNGSFDANDLGRFFDHKGQKADWRKNSEPKDATYF